MAFLCFLLFLYTNLNCLGCDDISIPQTDVFVSGIGGYDIYRIPALAVTNNGTILAFCEGRKNGSDDSGNIDILLRRSPDNGKTWSENQIVWDDSTNTCGNPCPILDRDTGTIFLLMTWNNGRDKEKQIIEQTSSDTRRVFISSSNNDGKTWTKPKEITRQVKEPDWTWYATGPGAGIQIERGNYKGRLVAPCDHIVAGTKHYYSHAIFSDDHGKTWRIGFRTQWDNVNECQVAEVSNGRLMLNMRNYNRNKRCRQTAISNDGGITWNDQRFDPVLTEPICQASLRAFSWKGDGSRKVLFFSNPADTSKRVNMTLRASLDEGGSWPVSIVLHRGPCAYSDLVIQTDNKIGCLFEAGDKNPYEKIVYMTYEIDSIIESR